MKTSSHQHPFLCAAFGALIVLPIGMSVPAGAEEDHHADLVEKNRRMQERMSKRFHDGWQELRHSMESRGPKIAGSAASVDLREQNDGYTVRVSLPGRDLEKVEVSLTSGNQLRILAPAGETIGRYEQTLILDGVPSGAQPEIEKQPKKHLIIVRIPKTPASVEPAPQAAETPPQTLPPPTDRWDRDVLERMDRMCREMDEMFHQSFEEFGKMPDFKGFFDEARFGSSVELREENDKYVVRAYLPDRAAENVKVAIEDNRILKIEAVAEETTEKEKDSIVLKRKAEYSQQLTLPGPVDADAMKVERKKGMLVIFIPKKAQG